MSLAPDNTEMRSGEEMCGQCSDDDLGEAVSRMNKWTAIRQNEVVYNKRKLNIILIGLKSQSTLTGH